MAETKLQLFVKVQGRLSCREGGWEGVLFWLCFLGQVVGWASPVMSEPLPVGG